MLRFALKTGLFCQYFNVLDLAFDILDLRLRIHQHDPQIAATIEGCGGQVKIAVRR
jgi:hypothetical protein